MPGYFDDGTALDLGHHVFATPSVYRRNLRLDPHDAVGVVHSDGGGTVELQVTGQRVRANLGDAERWLYECLRMLACSGPGELGCEDDLGNRATFAQCVCTGAAGEVHAFRFAEISAEFYCGEVDAAPAWDATPAAPGPYPGTDWLGVYTAGGVALGHHAEGMRLEMQRQYPVREIPRARGARSRGPRSGAVIRLVVTSHATVTAEHLAHYLENLAREIGPCPINLVANGNTYEDVVLESVRPAHTDRRWARFVAEFVQTFDCLPYGYTTTTQEPTTTTTAAPTTTVEPTTTEEPTTTTAEPAPTTTTGEPGSTTTVEPTTTTTGEPPTTTTLEPTSTTTLEPECPSSSYCQNTCNDTYASYSFVDINCGSLTCSGRVAWAHNVDCVWSPSESANPCEVSSLSCSGGYWHFTMTHALSGQTCIYQKPATAASCPLGTYSKVSGTCGDCPSEAVVFETT